PRAARVGEPHASRRAHKELDAQLALESVQPGRERRLGDEQRLGSAAHAAPARDLQESLDLQELQAVEPAASGFVYGQGGRRRFYLYQLADWSPHLTSPHGGEGRLAS